ncbi:hypothetical protein H6F88_07235 [Oculatella sp. FACHB-28]|uniref:hypothetical protein n=1 Tax=Oculatella sp. FACHB-28 TaxID=2692845 RepID=UPI001686346D|nr:hypothetical protein [Oculatella sp. FACHB-28]MBD2055811.1 hypothetical protein [Oculatella sp. FACHB-28]
MSQKTFTHRFWMAIAVSFMFSFLSGNYQPAQAEDERIVIDMPVDRQVDHSELVAQAESLLGEAISRQFSQNPDLSTLQVDVVGDRNGEMIPILTVTVSRAQWQANPQVSAWSRYYRASYALLQRHEAAETVAVAPARAADGNTDIQDRFWIDEAFDSGRLTGAAAQDYLSDLD